MAKAQRRASPKGCPGPRSSLGEALARKRQLRGCNLMLHMQQKVVDQLRARLKSRAAASGRRPYLSGHADADPHDLARWMLEDFVDFVSRLVALYPIPDCADSAHRQLAIRGVVHIVKGADARVPADILIVGPGPFEAVVAIDKDGIESVAGKIE